MATARRSEAVERLRMIDAAIEARRRAEDWRAVRRLQLARSDIYLQVLDANAAVEEAGGEPMPRRRFER